MHNPQKEDKERLKVLQGGMKFMDFWKNYLALNLALLEDEAQMLEAATRVYL